MLYKFCDPVTLFIVICGIASFLDTTCSGLGSVNAEDTDVLTDVDKLKSQNRAKRLAGEATPADRYRFVVFVTRRLYNKTDEDMDSLKTRAHNDTCTGVIISRLHVMSSAHCVVYDNNYNDAGIGEYESPFIYVGTQQWNELEGHRKSVGDQANHPNFKRPDNMSADLTILTAKLAFEFDDKVNKIDLPNDSDELTPNDECVVASWGDVTPERTKPEQLMQANVKIFIPSEEQMETHKLQDANNTAFYYVDHTEAPVCSNEKGAPLICKNKTTNRWVVHGMLHGVQVAEGERGTHTCQPGIINTGVYVKVATYMKWIREQLSKNETNWRSHNLPPPLD